MDEFWGILQMLIFIFLVIQVERINHNLSNINKSLKILTENMRGREPGSEGQ